LGGNTDGKVDLISLLTYFQSKEGKLKNIRSSAKNYLLSSDIIQTAQKTKNSTACGGLLLARASKNLLCYAFRNYGEGGLHTQTAM
jgi:hypothetical protein